MNEVSQGLSISAMGSRATAHVHDGHSQTECEWECLVHLPAKSSWTHQEGLGLGRSMRWTEGRCCYSGGLMGVRCPWDKYLSDCVMPLSSVCVSQGYMLSFPTG